MIREERFRLACVAAALPLALLAVPFCLPYDRDRSLIGEALREPVALVIVGPLVVWPILLGAISLLRGLARKAPGMLAYAVPAVLYTLSSAGLALLLAYAFAVERGARVPIVAAGVMAGLGGAYLLLRGFRRAGWERWAQLVAGMWFGQGMLTSLFALGDPSDVGQPPAGGWILLFALGAFLPIWAWALWPRKGETPLWRWAAAMQDG
jgi:hypothetical protein